MDATNKTILMVAFAIVVGMPLIFGGGTTTGANPIARPISINLNPEIL